MHGNEGITFMADEQQAIYLSSFFTEADIVFEQTVPSSYNMVHQLVGLVAANHLPGVKAEPIVDAVLRRERTSPTVVGDGVALPHARIEGIQRPYMALGVYPAGIPLAEGEKPVRLVFLLLVPEHQPARYLQILRALATLLREPGSADRLAALREPAEIMHFLRRSEMKLPDYICAGDLMSGKPSTISVNAPLSEALELLMDEERVELPIVDEQERLVGAVDTHAFLGCFIPTGFRKLFPNLKNSPAPTLEALATRLRDASRTRVREVMNTDVCICQVDTPAREIAADLAERNAVKCYVVDKEGRLTGVISLAQFFRRILRD